MSSPESRLALLGAFDACAQDFTVACATRFEIGARLAGRDVQRLANLAERLAGDLIAWRGAIEDLEVAAPGSLEPQRAGALLVESVFDDVLGPEATGVLAAALDLALHPRPGRRDR